MPVVTQLISTKKAWALESEDRDGMLACHLGMWPTALYFELPFQL